MGDRVRVGVVGTSWYADLMHLPNLKSHPRVELVAICGRDQERAGARAQQYGIPQVFADYRALIERAGVDALVVATPDDLHHPITMRALDAGLHVLCEKPLALTAAQAQEMYRVAEAKGVKHMTFFTYRWLPHYRHAHRLLAAGYVGRPYHLSIRFVAGYGRGGRYGWKWDARRGLGALGDMGSHMIDLARWWVGEVTAVAAEVSVFVRRPGPDGEAALPAPANDAAVLALRFAGGAQGSVQVSAVAHTAERGQEQHLVLHGEAGTLEADLELAGPRWGVRGAGADDKVFAPLALPDDLAGPVDPARPLFEQLRAYFTTQAVGDRAFVDAILADRPATPSFYDGWRAQQVLDAALESSRGGAWVTVPA
jgi:predicted dehydrogenase